MYFFKTTRAFFAIRKHPEPAHCLFHWKKKNIFGSIKKPFSFLLILILFFVIFFDFKNEPSFGQNANFSLFCFVSWLFLVPFVLFLSSYFEFELLWHINSIEILSHSIVQVKTRTYNVNGPCGRYAIDSDRSPYWLQNGNLFFRIIAKSLE